MAVAEEFMEKEEKPAEEREEVGSTMVPTARFETKTKFKGLPVSVLGSGKNTREEDNGT